MTTQSKLTKPQIAALQAIRDGKVYLSSYHLSLFHLNTHHRVRAQIDKAHYHRAERIDYGWRVKLTDAGRAALEEAAR